MVLDGCWGPGAKPRVVVLYGFSTLEEVIRDGIAPAFRELWLDRHGEQVEFVTTFASSGEIIDQLISRYPAEIAIVPSELDAHRLPVSWRSWRELPRGGIIARTPLVIIVRPGNPRGIRDWSDLGREGIEVVHPDPATSGLGLLALLAEAGSPHSSSGEEEARRLLGIWSNVIARPPSARSAYQIFESGTGDALVAYEHEILPHGRRGALDADVVYPSRTFLAEPVVALIEKNITDRQRPLILAFADFLLSEDAVRIFEAHGFRPVEVAPDRSRHDWSDLEAVLTLDDFGGAVEARRSIIDGIWKESVLPALGESPAL
jgi:sulfate transport system substrate-binding protein